MGQQPKRWKGMVAAALVVAAVAASMGAAGVFALSLCPDCNRTSVRPAPTLPPDLQEQKKGGEEVPPPAK